MWTFGREGAHATLLSLSVYVRSFSSSSDKVLQKQSLIFVTPWRVSSENYYLHIAGEILR